MAPRAARPAAGWRDDHDAALLALTAPCAMLVDCPDPGSRDVLVERARRVPCYAAAPGGATCRDPKVLA